MPSRWRAIRDPATNLVQSMTDALGRTTAYSYDSMGNQTGITALSGTPAAPTTAFTYDSTFKQLTSVTDPLNHSWTFTHDGSGNLSGITDPLGHQTTAGYNGEGQIVSLTDPAGDTVQFGYRGAGLSSITDPLGSVRQLFNDGAARLVVMSDPLGNTTAFTYSSLDDLTSIIDAKGGVTAFGYDPDRNPVCMTDAAGH